MRHLQTPLKGWRVERQQGREVFYDTEGGTWQRAPAGWEADVEITMRTRGLQPLKLRKFNVDKALRKLARKAKVQALRLAPRRAKPVADVMARLDWGQRAASQQESEVDNGTD